MAKEDAKETNSDVVIQNLKTTLQQALSQATAPPLPLPEMKGLSPEQIAEKRAANQQGFINEANAVFQTAYQQNYAEIIKIPPMLGYFKNYSPEQVQVEIEKRSQIAGLKAGIEAVNNFVSSGTKPALNTSTTPEQPKAQVAASQSPVEKISSAELQARLFKQPPPLPSKVKATPPPLPERFDANEPPPLLSKFGALGVKGAYEELRDKKKQEEAAAKAEAAARPPLLSTSNKKP